jgi:hypothetical protein
MKTSKLFVSVTLNIVLLLMLIMVSLALHQSWANERWLINNSEKLTIK